MSSDFLKSALDGVISLVDGIDGLISRFGTLPTLLGTFAAGLTLYNGKGIFTFDKDAKNIKLFGTAVGNFMDKLNPSNMDPMAVINAILNVELFKRMYEVFNKIDKKSLIVYYIKHKE